jgi:hypothetical protein
MPDSTGNLQSKLLDAVRQMLRLHHYSIRKRGARVPLLPGFALSPILRAGILADQR